MDLNKLVALQHKQVSDMETPKIYTCIDIYVRACELFLLHIYSYTCLSWPMHVEEP